MRASYGTHQLLGLKPGGYAFKPKTAFLLIGERCEGGCAFCPQANGIESQLSRVTWPEIPSQDLYSKLENITIDRICIQAVKNDSVFNDVMSVLIKISKLTNTPISVSMSITSIEQAEELMNNGADIISIALDCATPRLASEIKSISFENTMKLLINLAKQHPGKVTTHLIAGLGETDRELIELSKTLVDSGINVSLFAFTPINGTAMKDVLPPTLSRYRKLQVAMALVRAGRSSTIEYSIDGGITHLGNYRTIVNPFDFQTPGCPGCNRPYYNERPGGILYHHPNPPDINIIFKEIK